MPKTKAKPEAKKPARSLPPARLVRLSLASPQQAPSFCPRLKSSSSPTHQRR